ncbi:MAG: ABC transporter substrate-binding protein [Thermodesulfobacteriota bacterium]
MSKDASNLFLTSCLTMKRIIALIIPALCLFSLMSPASGYTSEAHGGERLVYISIVAPFSGPLAQSGHSMLRGARLRMDEHGEESLLHGKAVRLIALDDRGESAQARQLAENIANHPSIGGVIGHLTTKCTLAAVPFYHAARLATVSPVASGSDLDGVRSPYLFRTILSERRQALSLAGYIQKTRDGKAPIALLSEDSELGTELKEAFLLGAEQVGLPVQSFSLGTKPFDSLTHAVHEIASLKPEALFVAGGYHSAALISRQWPEDIPRPLIVGTFRLISQEFKELVGNRQQGIIAAHPCIWDSDFHRGVKAKLQYEKTWKYRMDWLAAQTYDAVDLLLWAIRESGSNVGSLDAALRTLNSKKHALPGLAGPIYFNSDGSLAREVSVAEYIDGRWRVKKEQGAGSKE